MAVTLHGDTGPLKPVPERPDPRTLTSLPEILSSISAVESEEADLSSSLLELLSNQEPIAVALSRIQSLEPFFEGLRLDAGALSKTVSTTALTARRVGGKVRSLDEEMRRVREAGENVAQAMELKSSLAALMTSMETRDWESATRHCSRAMAIPLEVTSGAFAEFAVPTPESPLPPAQTLQAAREQLLEVFKLQFNAASKSRDAAATSRFFKLFPAIGWEDEGLQEYASFVVDLVRVRTPAFAKTSSPLYYITALTALFENIAMIVDQHQPVVEKYYGPGKMSGVLDRLLEESDRLVKDLLEGWEEERAMKRKLSATANAPYSLAHSQVRRVTSGTIPTDEDDVDPREVDKVLKEAAGMSGRWSLFRRFLYDRLSDTPIVDSEIEEPPKDAFRPDFLASGSVPEVSQAGGLALEAVESSLSRQLVDDMLTTYYIPLELWYVQTIVDKAHRLSSPDMTQTPVVTTTPDDVFYILKVILSRLISTGSVKSVEQMVGKLQEIMERHYVGVIKKKLDEVYRHGAAASASTRDKADRESRQSFIILLNDLDVSSSHLERLIKELCSSESFTQDFLETEADLAKQHVSSLVNVIPRFKSTLRAGVEQLFNQLLRPKLRSFIPDVYKDISYVLDDDGYAAAEYSDLVRKRFIKAWENLVEGYKDTFTENNYRLFFGLGLDVLVRPWENFVKGLRFTELGAIRFDRDLRAVTSYLSSQTVFGDIREKFVRLQQISTVLNLDTEEDVDEFFNGSGIAWKLGEQEARVVASLRVLSA